MKRLPSYYLFICLIFLCLLNFGKTYAQEDTEPPVINIIGPVPQIVPCGGSYIEFGANVFDAVDGQLDFTLSGDCVCPTTAGSFIVQYSAIDASGNCTIAERLVIVQGECDSPPCEPDFCGYSNNEPCSGGVGGIEALDDFAQTQLGEPVQIPVLVNDTGIGLSVNAIIDAAEFGTTTIIDDQTIEYEAQPGFTGIDVFTYEITNGFSIDTGTVTVAVGVRLNRIEGHIFKDENEDCEQQDEEVVLEEWLVKVEPGPTYAMTDANGFYTLYVDEGDYTISQATERPYWETHCPVSANHTVSFEGKGEISTGNDFANKPLFECPLMSVNLGTPLIRACRENVFTVRYCNTGTIEAEDAYVAMKFDEDLTIEGSSIPFTIQGDEYIFDLGTIGVGECGVFTVRNMASCELDLGETVCVEAHIYPDEICTSDNDTWDMSSIVVNGNCEGDEAVFTITNVGEGDMMSESVYRVFKETALVEAVNFQLLSGESLELDYETEGFTMRLEAFQNPGHPGQSFPMVYLEGCGEGFESGLANIVGQDDADPFKDIECIEIIGSYDPNDKRVTPSGVGEQKLVHPEAHLEYHIRFQNTGTDTAFRVVIIDTLQKHLQVETIRSGVSSHPYQFEVLGEGVLKWTFEDILLPDSTVNEPESHGFVKFYVRMVEEVQEGTLLSNDAGIYFDFNEPVITDPCEITISEKARDFTTSIHTTTYYPSLQLYPNPAKQNLTIDTGTDLAAKQDVKFLLFNTLGQLQSVHTVSNIGTSMIDIEGLQQGLYLFQLKAKGEVLANGKVLIE